MKRINKDEFDMITKSLGNPILQELLRLEFGEGMTIERHEWQRKSHPYNVISNYGSRHGKKFITRTLGDDKGWAVLRIK